MELESLTAKVFCYKQTEKMAGPLLGCCQLAAKRHPSWVQNLAQRNMLHHLDKKQASPQKI
jgi:hypothetical protein